MTDSSSKVLHLTEDRYARFEAVEWWSQERLKQARVLVVGAGALGNELLKNLALLGVGNLVIVDRDRIEKSNLSRSVLFREGDEGRFKAERAAEAVREICPDVRAFPIVGDVTADVGLGWFRWADVIGGALDNREARVFVNAVCSQLGKRWTDGGIEVLNGIVRGFAPPETACYECLMTRADWRAINQRRSCSLLARRALAHRGAPTTPTTASVIGGMQAQEMVKVLHGLAGLEGQGFFFEGLNHTSYKINYQIHPECGWHEPVQPLETAGRFTSDTPFIELASRAAGLLGGLDALDFPREIMRGLTCPECGFSEEVWAPLARATDEMAVCRKCGREVTPNFIHSIGGDSDLLEKKTPRTAGLPAWDILWARFGEKGIGIEITGDRPFDDTLPSENLIKHGEPDG